MQKTLVSLFLVRDKCGAISSNGTDENAISNVLNFAVG